MSAGPSPALAEVAAETPPVDLAGLDAEAALRTRVDVKYLVPAEVVATVVRALDPARRQVLEVDGRRRCWYRSVYFDTPCLATYRAHLQGRRRRFKVRTRTYLDHGARTLELKRTGFRDATVKARLPYDGAPADQLTPEGAGFLRSVLEPEFGDLELGRLGPTVRTTYARTTFCLPGRGERITCDVALESAFEGRAVRLEPHLVLVESKSPDGRGEVDRRLREAGIRPVRISKHAVGIAGTSSRLPGAPWRPALRHFRCAEDLSTPHGASGTG